MKVYTQNYAETWKQIATILQDFPTLSLESGYTPHFADIIQTNLVLKKRRWFDKELVDKKHTRKLFNIQLNMPDREDAYQKTATITASSADYNASLVKMISQTLEGQGWSVELKVEIGMTKD